MSDTAAPNSPAQTTPRPRRITKDIGWQLNYDRVQAATIKREAYLRSLMGLPEKPDLDHGRAGK